METKSAFVAIVGRPNVGKSSLMNAMLGEKVAIVTPKPQTTRTAIRGVVTRGETQLVFTDTPGMHRPRTKLSEYMVNQISQSVSDGDFSVFVADATDPSPAGDGERALLEQIKKSGERCVLALNKIDALPRRDALLGAIARWNALYPFEETVPVSALTGEGVGELMDVLCAMAQPSPHFFDDDTLTDQPERVIAAELIREKLMTALAEEVPHGIAVTIEKMHEREEGGLVDIDAVIVCERQSHKGIVIGKGGAMLKKIASQARADLERFLGCRVNLQCWVKVREDWRQDARSMRALGFK